MWELSHKHTLWKPSKEIIVTVFGFQATVHFDQHEQTVFMADVLQLEFLIYEEYVFSFVKYTKGSWI